VTFKTELAVEMTCESCVEDVRKVLRQEPGVEKYDISLKEKRVTIEGAAPPSRIARALKETGRQVIVRGAGTSSGDHDGAAVCIFEAHKPLAELSPNEASLSVGGVARLVQTGDTTIMDLSLKFPTFSQTKTPFWAYVAKTGDISEGPASTGGILRHLGPLDLSGDREGTADLFCELDQLKIWEMIGRAMVIAPVVKPSTKPDQPPQLGPGILAGVIARSAGAWANDKTVCSCSGLTMWEEARLQPNL